MPRRSLFAIANSIARTTFAVSPCPCPSSTRRPISRALGATPTNSLAIKPGDVRAMTVRIDRRHCANVALSEVVERRNAIVEVGAGLDTRIDDRDADAGAAAGLRKPRRARSRRSRCRTPRRCGYATRAPAWWRKTSSSALAPRGLRARGLHAASAANSACWASTSAFCALSAVACARVAFVRAALQALAPRLPRLQPAQLRLRRRNGMVFADHSAGSRG